MEIILDVFLKPLLYVLGYALSTLAIYAFGAYVIPFLKTKLGEEKYNALVSYTRMYMAAVEERFPELDGERKSEWVINQIKQQYPALNNDYLQTIIDGLMQPLSVDGIINARGSDRMAGF